MSREPLTDMHPFGREFWLGDNGPGYKWGPIICLTRAGDQVRVDWCCHRGHATVAQAKAHAAKVQRRIEATGG